MIFSKYIKIILFTSALSISINAEAASVKAFGQKFKTEDELREAFYRVYGTGMENRITSKTLSSLNLSKIDGKFLVIIPSTDFYVNSYIPDAGDFKSKDTANLAGFAFKLVSEGVFLYFQRMGLMETIDLADENTINDKFKSEYDYIITMKSDFNGKRDVNSVFSRKTEFFVKNSKTGREEKFTEIVKTPALDEFFDSIAVKFSDAVNATN
jgi:hypothetical protein